MGCSSPTDIAPDGRSWMQSALNTSFTLLCAEIGFFVSSSFLSFFFWGDGGGSCLD